MEINYWKEMSISIKKSTEDEFYCIFKKQTFRDTNAKKIVIDFLNNPLKLDNSYKLVITISDVIVYNGTFDKNIEGKIPFTSINKKVLPQIWIFKNGKIYGFSAGFDKVFTIAERDDLIHIVFVIDEYASFYFNSTESWRY